MAETRVEKYREYRKSIISGTNDFLKTPIDTSLKTTSKELNVVATEAEAVFLRKIRRREYFSNILFLVFVLAILLPIFIFGIILF